MPNTSRLTFGKRGKLLAFAGLVLVTVAVAACFIKPPPEPPAVRINGYTVLRIRLGMTRPDVEAIFRVPAGEYSSLADPNKPDVPTASSHRPDLKWEAWGGDSAVLFVHFGPDGKADDWEAHLRHTDRKRSKMDRWLDTIKYKWLGW